MHVCCASGSYDYCVVFVIIDTIHKYVRDKYSKRFPELESMVYLAHDYMRTVQVGGACYNDDIIMM